MRIFKTKIMETIMYLVGYNHEWIKTTNSGWGCGYVMVPLNHPFMVNLQAKLDEEEARCIAEDEIFWGGMYPQIYNDKFEFYEEITYYEDKEVDGVKYKVFGFDTGHMNNSIERNPFEDVLKSTQEMKKLIDSKI
jgi:hypothetical protein